MLSPLKFGRIKPQELKEKIAEAKERDEIGVRVKDYNSFGYGDKYKGEFIATDCSVSDDGKWLELQGFDHYVGKNILKKCSPSLILKEDGETIAGELSSEPVIGKFRVTDYTTRYLDDKLHPHYKVTGTIESGKKIENLDLQG